jgi:hypothetical protein
MSVFRDLLLFGILNSEFLNMEEFGSNRSVADSIRGKMANENAQGMSKSSPEKRNTEIMADQAKKYTRESEAAKKREHAKGPTLRQSRLAKEIAKGRSLKEAAIAAGYPAKHASQSAHQALQGIRLRVPEILDQAGYSVPVLIEKHIAPKLSATVTRLAVADGKFTDFVELEDHDTQMKAADIMLRMHGAYTPKDPAAEAQFGVKVIIVDTPRPQRGVIMKDIGPGDPLPLLPSNGHKPQE